MGFHRASDSPSLVGRILRGGALIGSWASPADTKEPCDSKQKRSHLQPGAWTSVSIRQTAALH